MRIEVTGDPSRDGSLDEANALYREAAAGPASPVEEADRCKRWGEHLRKDLEYEQSDAALQEAVAASSDVPTLLDWLSRKGRVTVEKIEGGFRFSFQNNYD